mgnify:CR=1 FL=1|tara:strand:+ start:1443 stop:3092 length:1650 start_codon:yes stop_codon:yes gene_type:complete
MNKLKSIILMTLLASCASPSGGNYGPAYESSSSTPVVVENVDPLDVSIAVFNPGIPSGTDEYGAGGVWPELRRAEAMHLAVKLRDQLSSSQNFAAVRVTPDLTSSSDLYVKTKIISSNGLEISLKVSVIDSTGKVWINNKSYKYRVPQGIFDNPRNRDKEDKLKVDPYQQIYLMISNDLASYLKRVKTTSAENIRTVTSLRFAQNFSPQAFSDILKERQGRYTLTGKPDSNNRMIERTRNVQYRDQMFIDSMQTHYDSFSSEMKTNYSIWQQEAYLESLAAEQAKKQARRAGFGAALMALATIAIAGECDSANCVRNVGSVGAAATGALAAQSAKKRQESRIHLGQLNEIGKSLDQSLSPSVIEMEDTTVTLTGTANEQFNQWRGILKRIYEAETMPTKSIEVLTKKKNEVLRPVNKEVSIQSNIRSVLPKAIPVAEAEESPVFEDDTKDESPIESLKVVEARPIRISSPQYTESLRSEGLEGSVIVKFDIDTDGRVVNSFILRSSGHNELDVIALEAMQQLRYSPKLVGGIPAITKGKKRKFTFTLED